MRQTWPNVVAHEGARGVIYCFQKDLRLKSNTLFRDFPLVDGVLKSSYKMSWVIRGWGKLAVGKWGGLPGRKINGESLREGSGSVL